MTTNFSLFTQSKQVVSGKCDTMQIFNHYNFWTANLGTCEALLRYSIRIRIGRSDSKILNRRACHVYRCTINNIHCSTTNFNRFGIITGIYIEYN